MSDDGKIEEYWSNLKCHDSWYNKRDHSLLLSFHTTSSTYTAVAMVDIRVAHLGLQYKVTSKWD
jgi:hypothetical protein